MSHTWSDRRNPQTKYRHFEPTIEEVSGCLQYHYDVEGEALRLFRESMDDREVAEVPAGQREYWTEMAEDLIKEVCWNEIVEKIKQERGD